MCKAALLTISAVLLTTAASAEVVRRHSVPERFRGRWLGTNGSVMELTARSYASREANCTVDWVSKIAGAQVITHPLIGTRFCCLISSLRRYRAAAALKVIVGEMSVVRPVAMPLWSFLLERYWSEAEHLSNGLESGI